MLVDTMFSKNMCVRYSRVFVVICTAVCLLLDPTSATEASPRPSAPLVFFCHGAAIAPLQYSREYLLNLQYGPNILPPNLESDIPNIVNNKKKRGSRGGVRNRLKKSGYRPPLSAITLNVRSLQNKMDELSTLITTRQYGLTGARKRPIRALEVGCA